MSSEPAIASMAHTAGSRVARILVASGKEFLDDGGPRLGAALSYYTLFSLVPLLFLAAAVVGYIFGDPDALNDVVARAIVER